MLVRARQAAPFDISLARPMGGYRKGQYGFVIELFRHHALFALPIIATFGLPQCSSVHVVVVSAVVSVVVSVVVRVE